MSQMNMGPGAGPSLRPGAAPGQMTAVMRAMQVSTGPKVLRIGLVNAGRVLEERVIKNRVTVTAGPSEKATFVLAAQQLSPFFKLFELIGNDYHLNFLDGMTGRVALTSGISDLAALRGQAKKVGNTYQIKLTEDARGKVVIGDTTFLFQFVTPPPVQPRPQLPLAVQGGFANQIDWTLTIVAAFSFLFHFGLVGLMYSDWMDPPVAEGSVADLVDMMKSIPVPPVDEKKDEPVKDDKATEKDVKPDPNKTASKAPAGGAPAGASGPKGSSVSDTKAAAMAQAADQMQMAMLASLGGATATQGALNRSDIPPVDLAGAAKSGAGVTAGTGDLKMGSGGGPVQGGGNGKGGLGGIGGGTKGTGEGGGAGTETKVAAPKGDAQTGGVGVGGAPVSDADRVIAGLRPRFRSCYQTGLNVDPNMEGKVTISAKVGPNGEVESASVSSNSGLSSAVAACIAGHVKRAQFSAPGGSGSNLSIPVTFKKQN
jgi:hypothetical protein